MSKLKESPPGRHQRLIRRILPSVTTSGISEHTDTDGLSDGQEFLTPHTNPLVGDTDEDGFLDGYEVLTSHLPLVATDTSIA
jgi:hypothetical protein